MTFVALSVQTSGRNRPVASANPATAPVASAVGVSLTVYAVPDGLSPTAALFAAVVWTGRRAALTAAAMIFSPTR